MNSQDDFIDLHDVVSLLRRQFRLILVTVALILGVALVYVVTTTPLYTASTLLLVDPGQKDLLSPEDSIVANSNTANAVIESEVEILRSDAVALKVIERAGLLSDPEFGPSLSLMDKLKQAVGINSGATPSGQGLVNGTLNRFKAASGANRKGLTYLISVSVTSQSPEQAANLANVMAQTYIDLQVESKVMASLAARDVLQGQLSAAQQALATSETALQTYIDENIDRLTAESDSTRIAALRQALETATASRLAVQAQLETASGALETGDWAALAGNLENDALRVLESQREALARQLASAEDGTELAVNLREGLAQIEGRLQVEAEAAVAELRSDVTTYRTAGDQARESFQRELLASNLSPETLSEIYALQQEASIAQRQYDTLLSRMRDQEARALVQIADSRIVSAALPPSSASFPNKKLIMALALVASLGLGVGLAFLNEFYVGGILSTSQLANLVPAKVGAVIPRQKLATGSLSVADAIIDMPMSPFSEAFRRLRAAIDQFVPREEARGIVIMVTSSIPAEGKSVDALSLARTYATAGKSTLLIDADMRKPTQHRFLGIEPSSSLLDYLVGDEEDMRREGFYEIDRVHNLGVILGQRRSDIPTDQPIQSTAFQDLITNAANSFDVVIIDTPPLLPVVDARYIAPLVDCALLCVRFGETGQTDLRNSYEQLVDSMPDPSRIITVLNFHETRERGYKYSSYYGYGTDD